MAQTIDTASYPPALHILRDLHLQFEHGGDESRAWLPVVAELADAAGEVRLGVLATLVDVVGGGLAGIAAAPGWIATADLSVHRCGRASVDADGDIVATARVLRAGRTTVVIQCDLQVAAACIATAHMTFAVLERRASNPVVVPGATPTRTSMATAGRCLDRPILDAVGITITAPGHAELEVVPYVSNSLGATQGGVLATLAEVAAESVDPAGRARAVDLQLAYTTLAKVGPIRATASDLGAGCVRVELRDEGLDRATTTALVRTEVR